MVESERTVSAVKLDNSAEGLLVGSTEGDL